jgi:hypothetical protein
VDIMAVDVIILSSYIISSCGSQIDHWKFCPTVVQNLFGNECKGASPSIEPKPILMHQTLPCFDMYHTKVNFQINLLLHARKKIFSKMYVL